MNTYNIGDWIRFYSNSLRGETATTHIGEITKINHNRDGDITDIFVKNAVMGYQLYTYEIIGKIDKPMVSC